LVGKVSSRSSSTVRVEGFDRGVVQRGSGPGHRLHDTEPGAGGAKVAGGVLAAAVDVQHHPGHVAAAECDRHGQCVVGGGDVVMLGQAEPDDPA
jgi:hypothetical protein